MAVRFRAVTYPCDDPVLTGVQSVCLTACPDGKATDPTRCLLCGTRMVAEVGRRRVAPEVAGTYRVGGLPAVQALSQANRKEYPRLYGRMVGFIFGFNHEDV